MNAKIDVIPLEFLRISNDNLYLVFLNVYLVIFLCLLDVEPRKESQRYLSPLSLGNEGKKIKSDNLI